MANTLKKYSSFEELKKAPVTPLSTTEKTRVLSEWEGFMKELRKEFLSQRKSQKTVDKP